MRRNRLILLICWILTLVGISFYGGPVSYGFFIAISMIPLIALLYIFFVILQFKIYQRLDERRLIANRTSLFYFTLQNEGFMTFAGIRVFFYVTFSTISGLEDATEYELPPHTGIKKQTELVCRYRGEYEVGIKKIVVADFFRLFSIPYKNREPLIVRVKPDLVHLTNLRAEQKTSFAAKDSNLRHLEPDVIVREYVPYDDPRLIHWKATANMQKLMVRQKTDEQQKGIGLIMTPKRIGKMIEEYLPRENKIIEAFLALSLYFVQKGIPLSAYVGTRALQEYQLNGQRDFDVFYDQMSEYAFDPEREDAYLYKEIIRMASIFEKRHVFLVTNEPSAETQAFVKEITKNGIGVTIYAVTDRKIDEILFAQVARCDLFQIPIEANLTEVM